MAKLLFPIILLFFAGAAHAASPGDVVINEIAWMGSPAEGNETASQAANDEWLELFNTGANAIDLSGWVLKSTDNNPTIQLGGSGEILRIEAGAYFLLSRANQTVVGVSADLVYPYDTTKSSLGNSGEHLQLLDAGRNVIDDINAFGNWFAGDNITKQTMERKHPQLSGSDPDSWGGLTPIVLPMEKEGAIYLRFNIRHPNAREIIKKAKQNHVLLGDWYKNVIDPVGTDFEKMGYTPGSCPKAEIAANESINLPTHINISGKNAQSIIDFLKNKNA